MRIAVTYENGSVFQHFGHTEQFKVYDTEKSGTAGGERITASAAIDSNGAGHGALAGMLADMGVDTLICGGIGSGARQALDELGIRLYAGVSGGADKAVDDLLSGSLSYDPNAECEHHGEGHGQGGSCLGGGHGHGCMNS